MKMHSWLNQSTICENSQFIQLCIHSKIRPIHDLTSEVVFVCIINILLLSHCTLQCKEMLALLLVHAKKGSFLIQICSFLQNLFRSCDSVIHVIDHNSVILLTYLSTAVICVVNWWPHYDFNQKYLFVKKLRGYDHFRNAIVSIKLNGVGEVFKEEVYICKDARISLTR